MSELGASDGLLAVAGRVLQVVLVTYYALRKWRFQTSMCII